MESGIYLKDEDSQQLGLLMKLWREVNGVTATALAIELGMGNGSKYEISRFENGYRIPLSKAIRIADLIGATLSPMRLDIKGYRITVERHEG